MGIMCLVHHRFRYTTSTNYYTEIVYEFYDYMVIDLETRLIRVTYGNNVYTISIEIIAAAMEIQPRYTGEPNPKVPQALGDWVEEIVPCDNYKVFMSS